MYTDRATTKQLEELKDKAFAIIIENIKEGSKLFKNPDEVTIELLETEDIMYSHSMKFPGVCFKIQCSEPNENYRSGYYKYNISFWTMVQLPGCCGIVVSTGAWVSPEFRKLGLGTILNKMRIELAKVSGYSLMLCTDVTNNEPQQKILDKNGWTKIFDFVNSRTGNEVGLHVLMIP